MNEDPNPQPAPDNWAVSSRCYRYAEDQHGRLRRMRRHGDKWIIVGPPVTSASILAQFKRPD